MNDNELLELLKSIDPQAVRVPPGVRKIVDAAIDIEREACANVCDKIARSDLHGQAGEAADAIRMRSNVKVEGLT